ncbi:uncharacterized protein [Ovis canadensis]|uniref:uncharacterized protein isoform X2 n=1 Tax=Ovis canadensis TaxID=37174 RepID=UPI003751248A
MKIRRFFRGSSQPRNRTCVSGTSALAEQRLQRADLIAVAHRLRCLVACGIVPDQGSNLCPWHWQADLQLLDHQVLTLAESKWKPEGKGALDVVQRGRPPGQRAGGEEWKVDLGKQKDATAAAAAKSLQSCPTLCDPRDDSPPGSPAPGILQYGAKLSSGSGNGLLEL